MGKVQYYYNSETCNYEKILPNRKKVLRNIFFYVFLSFSLAASAIYTLSLHYPSPKEVSLEIEKENLEYKWKLLEKESKNLDQLLSALWIHDEEMRRILELDSLPIEIRKAGFGGSELYARLLDQRLIFEEKIVGAYTEVEKLRAQLNIQDASLDTLMRSAMERDKFWASIPAIQPVENKNLRRLSTVFGMRLHPIYKKWMPHKGFDFMGKTGVPIYATGDGIVKLAQMTYGGFGKLVILDHGYNYETRYAHLNSYSVMHGQKVKRGELIGFMGNSGRSAGPHLHYEVLKDGVQVNPMGFFEREMGADAFANLLEHAKQVTIPLD
jgi:murein DD-endopeptidase MepM/ murein hydrolase activator NlpD